ncbi:MAG: ribosome biogenesis GTPase YlqF [Clostridiales bacterium]|nr:ribosome biogenesis GTPase YlqF [Clostridiales bacterium]
MAINWYPGHMAKAKREMEANIGLIDCAVELLDARAPLASRNPDLSKMLGGKPKVVVLNKSDLADAKRTKEWISYFKSQGESAVAFTASRSGGRKEVLSAIDAATKEIVERWKKRGAKKTIRVMVCGIPNVGKSSLINNLSGAGRAKTGSRPGVTRGKQWVRLTPYLELMDTPGVLWPKLEDEAGAKLLAYMNAINDDVLAYYELAIELSNLLFELQPERIVERYGVPMGDDNERVLLAVAKARGFLQKGQDYDLDKAARVLMEEFRSGKIGRFTLQTVPGEGEA